MKILSESWESLILKSESRLNILKWFQNFEFIFNWLVYLWIKSQVFIYELNSCHSIDFHIILSPYFSIIL